MRILKGLFIILLIFTVSEIAYYIYYQSTNKLPTDNSTYSAKPTVFQKIISENNPEEIIALYRNIIEKNPETSTAKLIIEQEAIVTDIKSDFSDKYLVLGNNKGDVLGEYMLGNNIRISSLSTGDKNPIGEESLKINDRLKVITTIDVITAKQSLEFILLK